MAELTDVKNATDLESWRIKYLGTKGQVKDLMKLLATVSKEEKPALGQKVNAAKDRLTTAFETQLAQPGANAANQRDAIDVTEPGDRQQIGSRHILQ